MSRKSNTAVLTPARVRALFADGTLNASDVTDAKGKAVSTASLTGSGDKGPRGRVHPAFAAHAEAKGFGVYAEKTRTEKTVTVTPVRKDAKGRTRTLKPREVPLSQVRTIAGIPANQRGRLPQSALDKAAEVLGQK